jgi:hypothetical protein
MYTLVIQKQHALDTRCLGDQAATVCGYSTDDQHSLLIPSHV